MRDFTWEAHGSVGDLTTSSNTSLRPLSCMGISPALIALDICAAHWGSFRINLGTPGPWYDSYTYVIQDCWDWAPFT